MNNISGSISPNSNSRSPVTLGDFIKTRKSKKISSPDSNGVKILRRPIHSNMRYSAGNPRNLFAREDGQIDFSVNDIVFEKVENQLEEEMKWSENDVNFSIDPKPCSYRNCLQNDSGFRAFNSFRLNSYSSEDSDINFNNEHFYLPDQQQQYTENGTTYFPFERVEDDTYLGPDEVYYGTTFYQGQSDDQYYYGGHEEQQVVPGNEELLGSTPSAGIESITRSFLGLNFSQSSGEVSPTLEVRVTEKDKSIEKDEELNNLVLSIIDDE